MLPWKLAFLKTLNGFLEHTTLNGYRYLVEPKRHWTEKLMWFVVNVLAGWGVCYFVLHTWDDFTTKPTVTTIQSTQYPIWEVPFPGISICPVNKISKSAAIEYAEYLQSKMYKTSRNISSLVDHIRYMGRIYDMDLEKSEEYTHFQDTLDNYDSIPDTGLYDMEYRMNKLMPQCSQILAYCRWLGKVLPCLDIFTARETMEGFCCTFNYIRGILGATPKVVDSPGPGLGLMVVVNPQLEDYFYPLLNTEGFNVHIFNPTDYPDTPSGGLIEKVVPLNTEMFLHLDASTVKTVPDVKHFPIKQRGCIFDDETHDNEEGDDAKFPYSYSDCLSLCRVRSIQALCGCRLFYLLDDLNHPDRNNGVVNCTLQHVPCLNKYKKHCGRVLKPRSLGKPDYFVNRIGPQSFGVCMNNERTVRWYHPCGETKRWTLLKWRTLKPTSGDLSGLEHEVEDSLSCPDCYPACSGTSYFVQSTWAPIVRKVFQDSNDDVRLEIPNYSIIRIFFGSSDTILYRQDVLYYWYEIVSNFGGICGLFIGFSLMSVIEVIYFFTVIFVRNLLQLRANFQKSESIK